MPLSNLPETFKFCAPSGLRMCLSNNPLQVIPDKINSFVDVSTSFFVMIPPNSVFSIATKHPKSRVLVCSFKSNLA